MAWRRRALHNTCRRSLARRAVRSKGPCLSVAASAFLVFFARELALACDRKQAARRVAFVKGLRQPARGARTLPADALSIHLGGAPAFRRVSDEFDDLPLLLDAKDVEAETEMV